MNEVMPFSELHFDDSPTPCLDAEFLHFIRDHEFDLIYPDPVQRLSRCHWTPAEVCRMAARFLVPEPDIRVLDIGCGPGKFCAIGAATTCGHFTGVEQREHLVSTAREMLQRTGVSGVEIIHANITDVSFRMFDAFYLFNPFQENIFPSMRIDRHVELEPRLYASYLKYVQQQLAQAPAGTRVATYCGDCEEIPGCYDCEETAVNGQLRFWIKNRRQPLQAEAWHSDLISQFEALEPGLGAAALA